MYPISILAPTQRATQILHRRFPLPAFQSSPPHKGRRDGTSTGNENVDISILAPTQRATHGICCGIVYCPISILAPTQRATTQTGRNSPIGKNFNPRPHTKGDSAGTGGPGSGDISILAPTQRATRVVDLHLFVKEFQSSPPHKGRLKLFKPEDANIAISILAPTQRATAKITINSHF